MKKTVKIYLSIGENGNELIANLENDWYYSNANDYNGFWGDVNIYETMPNEIIEIDGEEFELESYEYNDEKIKKELDEQFKIVGIDESDFTNEDDWTKIRVEYDYEEMEKEWERVVLVGEYQLNNYDI